MARAHRQRLFRPSRAFGRLAKGFTELRMGQRSEALLSAYPVLLCRPIRAFPFHEAILTGGSRTPAEVVSAHSGLSSSVKRVHSNSAHGMGRLHSAEYIQPTTLLEATRPTEWADYIQRSTFSRLRCWRQLGPRNGPTTFSGLHSADYVV